jgi:hypothetical protein
VATWLLVWLLLSATTTILLVACFAALVRDVLILGRSFRRFSEEVLSMVDEVSRQGARTQERASRRGSIRSDPGTFDRTSEGFSPGGPRRPRR